jgi:transposase-like protein
MACPDCGSDDVWRIPPEGDEPVQIQDYLCGQCAAEWDDEDA